MIRWTLSLASGVLLSLVGFAMILGAVGFVMRMTGGGEVPSPQPGDPFWIAVGLARVVGAGLIALGIFAISVGRLEGRAAQQIRAPVAVGLAILTVLTGAQAFAIWDSAVGWILWAFIAIACAGMIGWAATADTLRARPGDQG
jgi:hypothetical protein